jgi:hypothetical protein
VKTAVMFVLFLTVFLSGAWGQSPVTIGAGTTTIDPKTGLPISSTIGQQPSDEELKQIKEAQAKKRLKGFIIGGSVLVVGLTIVYFVLRAKNKAQ